MSAALKLRPPAKPLLESREILGPAGNRVGILEDEKGRKEGLKKKKPEKRLESLTPEAHKATRAAAAVIRYGGSADSSSDSSTSGGGSAAKIGAARKTEVKSRSGKLANVVPDGVDASVALSSGPAPPLKRCDWITNFSEPLHASFHDEEWGVPVYDDRKLFELLVLSQALAEFTWPVILSKRDTFRRLFDNFDASSIASMKEKELLSMRKNGNTMLSESKLSAIIENAKQLPKIQKEFGSFSNYCWHFVNNKPIASGFRYGRQVPAKTPKSEQMSKDLMKRGFRCVGPTIIYSFMQVAGMVNDHLLTCFRFNECSNDAKLHQNDNLEKTEARTMTMHQTCSSHES